jgi:hypothetical protein
MEAPGHLKLEKRGHVSKRHPFLAEIFAVWIVSATEYRGIPTATLGLERVATFGHENVA